MDFNLGGYGDPYLRAAQGPCLEEIPFVQRSIFDQRLTNVAYGSRQGCVGVWVGPT